MSKSFKIADNLFLVQKVADVKPVPAAPVEVPIDHIFLYDCSGSMAWDLPKIREQVKKKFPKMLREQDTLTAVWFSGRGECGVLLEKELVATAKDLLEINRAVDRWLKPIGLTGFKEPIELAVAMAKKIVAAGRTISMTFMSDGCDNQWPKGDVLRAVEPLAALGVTSTFVEYGYYADRALLTQMAEKAGGTLIFAEDFDRYEPVMSKVIGDRPTGAQRVAVGLGGDAIGGFAFEMRGGDLVTYGLKGGVVTVPEDFGEIWYLSPTQVGETSAGSSAAVGALYAAISLFAVRARPDVVLPLLKLTGDVRFIDQFATCFGKQRYSAFMMEAHLAAFDPTRRLVNGYDPTRVPPDDAFTVMQLLEILQADKKATLLLDSPSFKYSRIGRGRVDVTGHLSDEDMLEVSKLVEQLSKEKDVTRIRELNAKLNALTEGKNEALRFVRTPQPDGYPILKLVYNEDRPNVSILTKRPGTIDLSYRSDNAPSFGIDSPVETYIYRNYAIVKDGLLNLDALPVRVSRATVGQLMALDVPSDTVMALNDEGGELVNVLLQLRKLSTINRKMVKEISAQTYFMTQFELVKAQAAQKVFNHYAKELLPARVAQETVSKYGPAGAAWLKSLGIGDGFSPPHTVQAESTDFYYGKELKASLKGLGSLPTVKLAQEGKGGAGGALMRETILRVETFLTSDFYVRAAAQEEMLRVWLDGERKAAIAKARGLIFEIAQMTFTIIVGQTWFKEFSTIEQGDFDLETANNGKIACKVEMKEVEIKV